MRRGSSRHFCYSRLPGGKVARCEAPRGRIDPAGYPEAEEPRRRKAVCNNGGALRRRNETRVRGHVPPIKGIMEMVPSLGRRGGCIVPRWFPGARNCGQEWCGRRDSNPHELRLNGFSYRLRLSPPGRGFLKRARQVCGLDYPFTVPRKNRGLGAARLVSTPSRSVCCMPQKDEHTFRAWLGIAIAGFPEFGQFCIAGFPGEHSSFLKSVASAGSATPACQ